MKYMNFDPDDAYEAMINFIDNNLENAIISILWHNHMLGKYKFSEWANVYIRLLKYLKAKGIESVTQKELIVEFAN